MKHIKKIVTAMLLTIGCFSVSFGLENNFYILRDNLPGSRVEASLNSHVKAIHILITQAYHIDGKGVISGSVDPALLALAHKNSLKLMVLVTNTQFSRNSAQHFLANREAQQKTIQSLLKLCQKYHYYGVQFDFENIPLSSRATLTKFYSNATEVLHQNGYRVSYAVVPVTADSPSSSAYLKRKYKNWGGAYDLKVLGKIGDFVSIMTYDQHEDGTTPGPTAGIPYVEAAIQHTLKLVPAHKLSLGIPTYSGYWYTDTKSNGSISVNLANIGYGRVAYLLNERHLKSQWDAQEKINYVSYVRHFLKEYIFIEDAKSFSAKLDLVKKYNLRGISVFRLGLEDPKIWDLLKSE